MKLHEIFLLRRNSKGLTQVELAEKAGISSSFYSRLETGKVKNLKTQTILSVCDVLELRLKASIVDEYSSIPVEL